ncbi:hypothetical protein V7161_17125 [Neobacillus drentensis]|uniref:hypothetical protein n=1 Tax=Neobacillus drentensis TaxID=220684 RepID=UPI0030024DA6
MKKLLVVLVALVLLHVFPSVVSAEENPSGWKLEGGTWHFYDAGVMKTGWVLDAGRWYYLGKDGAMQTGWVKDAIHWYYLDKHGVMKTGWVLDGGKWYYLDQHGAMKTGWVLDSGKWYYLDQHGTMKTGWVLVSGTWYYLDSKGAMVKGWKWIGSAWYYFSLRDGGMLRQNFADGYYLMDNGRMTMAGNADVVSVVEGLKKWIDVGLTQSDLQSRLGAGYHDLVGIEGEKYWLYTLKVSSPGTYKAVNWDADDFGAEDLANGSADVIVLVFWDSTKKAFQVSMDYFDANHKFHHYHSSKYDYVYN